jgi:hypothetical protein
MPFSEAVSTALFVMLVVFSVLVLLWALIRVFTWVIAALSGAAAPTSQSTERKAK